MYGCIKPIEDVQVEFEGIQVNRIYFLVCTFGAWQRDNTALFAWTLIRRLVCYWLAIFIVHVVGEQAYLAVYTVSGAFGIFG